jgi:hypothetical protein
MRGRSAVHGRSTRSRTTCRTARARGIVSRPRGRPLPTGTGKVLSVSLPRRTERATHPCRPGAIPSVAAGCAARSGSFFRECRRQGSVSGSRPPPRPGASGDRDGRDRGDADLHGAGTGARTGGRRASGSLLARRELYAWTTGRLPFDGNDALAIVSQHVHAPVVPPRAYRPNLPEDSSPSF